MKKLHMVIDIEKCIGCFNCLMACKDEHVDNSWLPYTDSQQRHEQKWINPRRHERGESPIVDLCYVTRLCNHCEDPPCRKNSPPGTVHVRQDGVVLLNPEKAKGNKALLSACPYGRISWNAQLQTAQKCTMCAHLLDNEGWRETRCVQACPLRALSIDYAEEADFLRRVEKEGLERLEEGSGARVWYKNLHRYNRHFVAGSVYEESGGVQEALAGVKVTLRREDGPVLEGETDFLGEFKFDFQRPGRVLLHIEAKGCAPQSLELDIGDKSLVLPAVRLDKLP